LGVTAALALLGFEMSAPRPPRLGLKAEEVEQVANILREASLL